MTTGRAGIVFGLSAFAIWGLVPLYWDLLDSTSSAGEVLGHRMVWSLPTAVLILLAIRRRAWIRPLLRDRRRLGLVLLSAACISANWYLFIWLVGQGRVLEASLGYFINPLLTIAMGVLLLRERLRPVQWTAVGIGGLAVLVMGVAYGQVPWLSVALSVSFALYGLVKKQTGLDGVEGFSADSAVVFLPALGFVLVLTARGDSTFLSAGPGHAVLLALTGLVTALPLILFGAAAVRIPLSTLGLMQYVAPATMFLLGLFVFDEEMPPGRLAGFVLVWTALSLLVWDAFRTARRNRRAVAGRTPDATPGGPAAPAAPAVAAAVAVPPAEAGPVPAVASADGLGPAAGDQPPATDHEAPPRVTEAADRPAP